MLATVLVGGFWLASAVYVGGLTWRAFSDTYTQFPDQGGGAGGLPPLPAAGKKIPKGTPGTGGTALEPAAVPSGPGVHAPPVALVNPLVRATRSGNKRDIINAWHQITQWGEHTKGWSYNSVVIWERSQPWGSSFERAYHKASGHTIIETQTQ